MIVVVAKKTKLIPAFLQLCKVVCNVVVLCSNGIHERAEVCGKNEVQLQFMHRLDVKAPRSLDSTTCTKLN